MAEKKYVTQNIHGTVTQGSGSTDHNRLVNRDKENQHPIEAISGLRDELDSKLDSKTALPLIQQALEAKACGLYYDAKKELARKAYWYVCSEIDPVTKQGTKDSIISGPYDLGMGGGNGGGSGGVTTIIIRQINWPSAVIVGKSTELTIDWSSVYGDAKEPTGPGTVYVSVNGKQVIIKTNQAQGEVSFDVGKYLVSGVNNVQVSILDAYGTTGIKVGTINAVTFELQSSFDASRPYTGRVPFIYTPYGNVEKTVYFEVDGNTVDHVAVTASGDQQTYNFRNLSHGHHKVEAYFTADVGGTTVTSNSISYDIIVYEEGNQTPIIASDFDASQKQKQYMAFNIPYIVYIDTKNIFDVDLYVNNEFLRHLSIGSGIHYWEIRESTPGVYEYKIKCGDTERVFEVTVVTNEITVTPESQELVLDLSAAGRDNDDPVAREIWKDEAHNITCEMHNFNWVSNGWVKDENNNTVLRVSGAAKVVIPYKPFAEDCKETGKTIELEIATNTIRDYNSTIISCLEGAINDSNARGFYVTPQIAALKSQQASISTQYKEDDHVHITFVVEPVFGSNRLIWMYINGVASGVVQYPNSDIFSQINPVEITIGSEAATATVDIYNIRIYNQALEGRQVVRNWISNTTDMALKAERYYRNDNYDDANKITINKLPSGTPYIIWDIDPLPIDKNDKRPGNAVYVDPLNTSKSFEAKNAEYRVQGTSSAGYPVKNIRTKYKQIKGRESDLPFEWYDNNGDDITKFYITEDGIGDNYFTFKVDFASSEGANNVELVKLYNDAAKKANILTPPQKQNSKVRVGIDGFPIIAFHQASDGEPVFCSKANFNNDKANHDVYGLAPGDESWEITNNSSELARFKTPITFANYEQAFESRYPDDNTPDKHVYGTHEEDIERLTEMSTWVASTQREEIPESATPEEAAAIEEANNQKLADFKAHLADYFDINSTLFYYLFTEMFLMVDSRAKNAFPTYFASRAEGDGGDRWFWLPYDMDTAIGINNEGQLVFNYNLEDTDTIAGGDVYNGQDSVLWNNVRDAFKDELRELYISLRNDRILDFDTIEARFEEHQAKWSENIFNEDAKIKYIKPLDNGDNYLPMLQGAKAEQRRWWLYNRFKYLDSKYRAPAATAAENRIYFRAWAGKNNDKPNLVITPYADIYATALFANSDSYLVQRRAKRNEPIVLENPFGFDGNENDQETYIYSASQLKSIGDISGFYPDEVKVGAAIKLQELKVGDSDPNYRNESLKSLELGNNVLLRTLDVRNCVNFGAEAGEGQAQPQKNLDLRNCINIEEVYLEGTKLVGVEFPDGGNLQKVHLPATLTSLTLKNQRLLQELTFEDGGIANLLTICLENIPSNVIDVEEDILDNMQPGRWIRFIGIDKTFNTYEEVAAFYNKLDCMKGLTATNGQVDKAQVTGTIHINRLSYAQQQSLLQRYPEINLDINEIICTVQFKEISIDDSTVEGIISYINYGDPINILQGSSLNRPAEPETKAIKKYTWTFTDWDHSLENIQEDLIITAQYARAINSHTVIFNPMSSLATVNPISATANYGELISEPTIYENEDPDAEDSSIEFTGWYTATGDLWNFAEDEVIDDIVLYAHWVDTSGPHIENITINSYKDVIITASEDFGIVAYGISSGQETEPATWLPLEIPAPYTPEEAATSFTLNFNISQDFAGPQYFWIKDNGDHLAGAGPITTYNFTKVIPTGVELELREADLLTNNNINVVTAGAQFNAKVIYDNHYTDFSLVFNGVEVLDNAEILSGDSIDLTINENSTLVINCMPKTYTVTFNTGDFDYKPNAQTRVYTEKVIKPAEKYENGYIISGWYLDPNYETEWNFDTDMVSADTVLYAKWEEYHEPTIITIDIPEISDNWIDNNYQVELNFSQTAAKTVRVNFDFNSENELQGEFITSDNTGIISLTHNYTQAGIYKVAIQKINPAADYRLGTSTLVENKSKAILMPSTIVTAIDLSWDITTLSDYALENSAITQLTLTPYFKVISKQMCKNCAQLTQIIWSNSVTDIKEAAFYGCINLAGTIQLPASISVLEKHAFYNCASLTQVSFLNTSVNTIPEYTFYGCANLSYVNFGQVSIVGASAFNSCGFTSISIPDTVTSLGTSAFYNCYNLTKVVLSNTNLQMGTSVFDACPNLKSAGPIGGDYDIEFAWNLKIPDNAFAIGYNESGKGITSIVLPSTIEEIGNRAFEHCTALSEINLNGCNNIYRIGQYAFKYCQNISIIDLPNTIGRVEKMAFCYMTGLTRVNVRASYIQPKVYEANKEDAIFNLCHITNGEIHVLRNLNWQEEFGDYFNYSTTAPDHEDPETGEIVKYKFIVVADLD